MNSGEVASRFEMISLSIVDHVATLTLNRPEKRNAMNPQLHFEVRQALTQVEVDEEARVLVVTGAGDSFSAGMDLKEYFHELKDNRLAKAQASRAAE